MSELIRKCPYCGTVNPGRSPFCQNAACGSDLTMVTPSLPASAAATPPPEPVTEVGPAVSNDATMRADDAASSCVLELADSPQVRFDVQDGQTVGRGAQADVVLAGVPKLEWISSRHALFVRRGMQWYVQHIGGTNYIKVNGERYDGPEQVAIYDGDLLELTYTRFRVRLTGG